MRKLRIALDIGHARNTGAVGESKEIQEHDLCTRLALELWRLLTLQGHDARLFDFPTLSNAADLNETVKAVNAWSPDILISLHANWAASKTVKGAYVLYQSEGGRILAEAIAAPLVRVLPGWHSLTEKRTGLAILGQTKPVAVLVEAGFITSKHDSDMLRYNREPIAEAIAEGVAAYARIKN